MNPNQDEMGRVIVVAIIKARNRTHSPRVSGVDARGIVSVVDVMIRKRIINDIYELGFKPFL